MPNPPIVSKQRPGVKPRTRPSVLDRIKPISFEADQGIHALLYGLSGTGKTTIAATFPAPILWITCSGGRQSGELRSVYTAENLDRIHEVKLEDSEDLIHLALEAAPNFATTVLDHGTGYQDQILKEVCELPEIPQQKKWGTATLQQYGQIANQFKQNVVKLLNLPGNVVIIAHQRTFGGAEDNEMIEPTVGAALQGSLTNWLNGAVDYIAQTFKRREMMPQQITVNKVKTTMLRPTGRVEYCLRIGPHAIYQTKFRSPLRGMPDILIDADYEKIMSVIRGEWTIPGAETEVNGEATETTEENSET